MKALKYYRVRISFEKHIEAESETEAKEITLDCMVNKPNNIEWEVERIGRKKCVVYGYKEELDKVEEGKMYIHVERCDNDKAEFFGVYEAQDDGTESWIADFRSYNDAVLFALEKEKNGVIMSERIEIGCLKCDLHKNPLEISWCEKNCSKYYRCDTVAAALERELKSEEMTENEKIELWDYVDNAIFEMIEELNPSNETKIEWKTDGVADARAEIREILIRLFCDKLNICYEEEFYP